MKKFCTCAMALSVFTLFGQAPQDKKIQKEVITSVEQKNAEALRIFSKQIDPNFVLEGHNPLIDAITSKWTEGVDILLENKANPNMVFKGIELPLITALNLAHNEKTKNVGKEIVNLLLDYGAKIAQQSYRKTTPLHNEAMLGSPETFNLLFRSSAKDTISTDEINCRDTRKRTPLHIAAMNNKENIVTILLEQGANPSLKDADGKTAADLAKSKNIKELIVRAQGAHEKK